MNELATNVLYYGDNLNILRRYLPLAYVDLVYLEPPFNSNRDYKVIFKDESGMTSTAQNASHVPSAVQPGDRWRGRAHELGIAAETPSPPDRPGHASAGRTFRRNRGDRNGPNQRLNPGRAGS